MTEGDAKTSKTEMGSAQRVVLRRALAFLSPARWVFATVVGVVIARVPGMFPGAIASICSPTEQALAAPQPRHATILLAAAGMGIVLAFVPVLS